MADEYGFITVDANQSIAMVFEDIRQHIIRILERN
jgi:thymidylate kinase